MFRTIPKAISTRVGHPVHARSAGSHCTSTNARERGAREAPRSLPWLLYWRFYWRKCPKLAWSRATSERTIGPAKARQSERQEENEEAEARSRPNGYALFRCLRSLLHCSHHPVPPPRRLTRQPWRERASFPFYCPRLTPPTHSRPRSALV